MGAAVLAHKICIGSNALIQPNLHTYLQLRADESGAVDNGNLMISLEDYPLLFEDMKK